MMEALSTSAKRYFELLIDAYMQTGIIVLTMIPV